MLLLRVVATNVGQDAVDDQVRRDERGPVGQLMREGSVEWPASSPLSSRWTPSLARTG